MSEKRWVCHISGQGEKWEIQKYQDPEWPSWVAPHTVNGGGLLYLPKSEYRLCDPPEVWRDITEQCVPTWDQFMCGPNSIWNISVVMPSGNYTYRLRKVDLREHTAVPNWAFIVEQKVTL